MSAINEMIVREFFETRGYMVNQYRKYVSTGRHREPAEEVDLVVVKPTVAKHKVPDQVVWTADSLSHVKRAVVGIRGWHTGRFSASMFDKNPELLRFAGEESIKIVTGRIGTGPVARILCLPQLPASGELKEKTIETLRARGIDGVLSFRTMLATLIDYVDTHHNYEKSDVLQMLRILKNYGLLRSEQMDLFSGKK